MSQPNSTRISVASLISVLADLIMPAAVVILFVLVGTLFRDLDSRQETIVVLNYERLTQLYTAETVRRDMPQEAALGPQTAMYLSIVGEVADEFAQTTGTLVIMSEAVVGDAGDVQDITDIVHLRAMERLRGM